MNIADAQFSNPLLSLPNVGADMLRDRGAGQADFANVFKEQQGVSDVRSRTPDRDDRDASSCDNRPEKPLTAAERNSTPKARRDGEPQRDEQVDDAQATNAARPEGQANDNAGNAPVDQTAKAEDDSVAAGGGTDLPVDGMPLPQALPLAIAASMANAEAADAKAAITDGADTSQANTSGDVSSLSNAVSVALNTAHPAALNPINTDDGSSDESAMAAMRAVASTVDNLVADSGLDAKLLQDGDNLPDVMKSDLKMDVPPALAAQNTTVNEGVKKTDFGALISDMRSMVDSAGSVGRSGVANASTTSLTASSVLGEGAARLGLLGADVGDKLAEKVNWLMGQNMSSARIDVDPVDLGPVQINISSHDDHLKVSFIAQHGAAREAIDQGSARLREILQQQGHTSVDVNVSQGSPQDRRDQQAGGSGAPGGERGSDELDGMDVDTHALTTRIVVARSLVDHFV